MTNEKREELRKKFPAEKGACWSPLLRLGGGEWFVGRIVDHSPHQATKEEVDAACEALNSVPSLLSALDAETERCARVCDGIEHYMAKVCAAAIRRPSPPPGSEARGKEKCRSCGCPREGCRCAIFAAPSASEAAALTPEKLAELVKEGDECAANFRAMRTEAAREAQKWSGTPEEAWTELQRIHTLLAQSKVETMNMRNDRDQARAELANERKVNAELLTQIADATDRAVALERERDAALGRERVVREALDELIEHYGPIGKDWKFRALSPPGREG